MDILTKIERAGFLATEQDIEAMAHQRQEGEDFSTRTSGTYLRVLVALTAREVGGATAHLSRRRGRHASGLGPEEVGQHLAALDRVASIAYGAVQRAVIGEDIAKVDGLEPAEATRRAQERNRRTNYARTSLTVVRAFINAGRDVRDLDVPTVTKEQLRATAERFMPPPVNVTVGRVLRAAARASERVVAEAGELASLDPTRAEQMLESLMIELQATLERVRAGDFALRDVGTTTMVAQGIRDRALANQARGSPAAPRAGT